MFLWSCRMRAGAVALTGFTDHGLLDYWPQLFLLQQLDSEAAGEALLHP